MSSGKEIHEIGRSLSSDRRRSFSPDKARERSIQDAHGQLEQLRPELKLLLSASEWSGTSEATSLEGKLDQLANKYQDDTAFGTDHENLPARLKKLATAFREHRGSRTSGNLRNLLEAWQSVTQEDNRVSSLSEIPSIEPMTLEEKIAKLRESKRDLQSLAKPLRRFTDTISAKCQLGKLKDPSQLENVIDSRLGQLQDKGASSSSIDETGTSTNRRKQLTHETQKFDLGEAFSGYSGVTLDGPMTNLRTSVEAKLEDLRKGCKISEELLSENNEFEKQRAILMGQHPQHKDLREPAERRYDNATTMEMTQDAKNAREAKIEVNSDNYESDESSYRLEIENCVRQIKKMGNIISGVNELINRRSAEHQLSMQINAVLPMLNCRTDVCKMLKQLLDAGYPVQSGDVDKYVRKALDSSGYTELQNKQRTTAAKLKLLTGEDFTDAARSMKQKLGRIDHHIQRLENEKAEEAPSKAEEAPSKAEEAPSKAEEAPSKAEEAPSKAEEAPSKAEEAPSKAEEAPSKAEEARLQAEKEVRLQAEKEVRLQAEKEVRLQADRQPLQVEKQQEISSESGTKSRELNKEELIEGVKKSRERITALENQLLKLRNEKSAVERTSADQSRQIEVLQAQIDPLMEEHGETEKTINKLNSDLKEQESEKRQLAARIQTLESKNSALQSKITKDEEAVRRLRGENSALQSKITKDEEAVRRLRGENSALQARAVRMESENSTLQVRVERAEESISILESENSTLRAKYEELCKISQEQDEYVQETKREKSAEQIKTERDEELVRRIENAKSDEKPLAVALHELLGEQAKQNQRELEAREAQNQRELEALRGQVANQQQLIHYYQHPHLYQYGPYPTYPS